MSTWKAHVQLRCFVKGHVIFSVNDATYAMSGHTEAHFMRFVARYLSEIASSRDDPFGDKSMTWASSAYMQIRGPGVYTSPVIPMQMTR